ncbi:hypothetical protein N7468_009432 [Penicillium chermesinum]|uniref:Uncharacterized protein n=1 Tax=Penicillium chermesinum TaxID=63820 RepID=A0A9W9NI61_9EURO|nr:uncharacterized protein N7468_009432 [Penicillium chermesinum]KAJ5220228.1 hypothetical protein N7468_009432 [Penicillium chermesinum]
MVNNIHQKPQADEGAILRVHSPGPGNDHDQQNNRSKPHAYIETVNGVCHAKVARQERGSQASMSFRWYYPDQV